MSNTVQFIFYTIGILFFVSAAVGLKFVGERAALLGIGLAVIAFVTWWSLLAAL